VYCKWSKNHFNYAREHNRISIQTWHHREEEWGRKHKCTLSSKSKSVREDAHIVEEGQEICRCQCHDEEVGDTKGDHTDWQDNAHGKYKASNKEKLRATEAVVHSMHFFPGVKPMYEPPARDWQECQESCRNIKQCMSWSMYTEATRVYGDKCRIYDVKLGEPETCDFTIPDFWTRGNFPCVTKQSEFGFQNIGAVSSMGTIDNQLHKSEKACKDLGWDTTNWGDEFHNTALVCGARPDCSKTSANYSHAVEICKSQGARLCTLAETQANEAAGKNCNFDKTHAVWTSTPCMHGPQDFGPHGDPHGHGGHVPGDHYYVQLANERWRNAATRDIDKRVHCTHHAQQTTTGNNDVGEFVMTGDFEFGTRIGGFLEIAVQCCADDVNRGCTGNNNECSSVKESVPKRKNGAWVTGRQE
jgi:hypothetical protein